MRPLIVTVVLGLAGCAAGLPLGQPVPQAARLSQDRLTLVLSDGKVCRAEWRSAPEGRFDGCAEGFGYAVAEVADPALPRRLWAGMIRDLGAEGALPPMAEVTITDPQGTETRFVSPVPVD